LRAVLRRQGQLIPDMELRIAATTLAERLTLVTRNVRRFARIPELSLYRSEWHHPSPRNALFFLRSATSQTAP
jgi:hypothetical protein